MTARVLITGVSGWLGGQLARRLERDPAIDTIVGADAVPPRERFQRTEFVQLVHEPAALAQLLDSARLDTIVETRAPRAATARSLAAALEASHSPPQKLVFASSAHVYGYHPDAAAFLSEEALPRRPRRAGITRQVLEAEAAIREFAVRHPSTTVTILRLADPIGSDSRGATVRLLGLPAIPSMLGFDPRWQLLEEHDAVAALLHAIERPLPGAYNVAADGILVLSEIASLLRKPLLPVLPPIGLGQAMAALRRLGLPVPSELVDALRFGRGLDNRRLKASGFVYRYTTREAILRLRGRQQPLALQRSLQDD